MAKGHTEAPEIAEWLTRFEKRFGVNETRQSMQKLESARNLFFDELGYNFTRKQFESLREGTNERIQNEILSNLKAETGKEYIDEKGQKQYRIVYRDITTNKVIRREPGIAMVTRHYVTKQGLEKTQISFVDIQTGHFIKKTW